MQPESVSDRFSLFNTASAETLEWFVSVSEEQTYAENSVLIDKEDWGKEVIFIVSGWVNICALSSGQEVTLDILSTGDYLGEIAILDDFPPLEKAIALSEVRLLKIPAQRFLQMLLKDSQLQQRMLQLTFQKVRHLYRRLKSSSQSSQRALIKTLMDFAKKYGKPTDKGLKILRISDQCFATMLGLPMGEIEQIIEKLSKSNLIEIDENSQTLYIPNLKKLQHFSKQLLVNQQFLRTPSTPDLSIKTNSAIATQTNSSY